MGRGFVNAGQLCIGSPLQNADGKILEVEQIYKEYLEEDEEVTVYNFQVEDWHTYHVGEMEVLVHNSDYGNRPPNMSPQGAKRKGAFREAKRKNNIPVSEQPKVKPNVDRRGKRQPGKIYQFKNGIEIRDDAAGHIFLDDPTQNRGPHFNDSNNNHFDY